MYNWDYKLDKNWQPKTDGDWRWYLTRVINYGLAGAKLNRAMVKKYLPELKIEDHKKRFLQFILQDYEKSIG